MPKAENLRPPVCSHCVRKIGERGRGEGGAGVASVPGPSRYRASFLSPLPVPPPHSSLFPFWSPTLFPKFLAWESRCQGPYWLFPSPQVCFLTCKLKMRCPPTALLRFPRGPHLSSWLPSFAHSSRLVSSLFMFLVSFSSPAFPFPSHRFLLISFHLRLIPVSPPIPL